MGSLRLWILEPRPDRPNCGDKSLDPWTPWYDRTFSMVVRAADEAEARRIASESSEGDEGAEAWGDPDQSSCVELTADGEPGIIISDTADA